MSAVAEQVDIVGDPLGLEERRLLGEGQERHGQDDGSQEQQGERATAGHRHSSVGRIPPRGSAAEVYWGTTTFRYGAGGFWPSGELAGAHVL